MNLRRLSTFSPMSVEKISSALTTSSSLHLQQRARFGVHGGVPELLGIHFAQPFEPRDGEIFLGVVQHVGQNIGAFSLATLSPLRVTGEGRMIESAIDVARQRPQPLVFRVRSKRPVDFVSPAIASRCRDQPARAGCALRRKRSSASRSSLAFRWLRLSFSRAFLSSKSVFVLGDRCAPAVPPRAAVAQAALQLVDDLLVFLHVQQEIASAPGLRAVAPSFGFHDVIFGGAPHHLAG